MATVVLVLPDDLHAPFAVALESLGGVEVAAKTADDAYLFVTEATPRPRYAVVHGDLFESRDELYALVDVLSEKRVPTALLFDRVDNDDFKKAVFLPSIDLGIELGEQRFRLTDAIQRIIESIAAATAIHQPVGAGSLHIGDLIPIDHGADIERSGRTNKPGTSYRMARWRSLIPLDGSPFSQDVRDVVSALERFPLRTVIPWNPRGHRGSADRPALLDLYRAFADDETRRSLYGGGDGPLDAATAEELLHPPRPEDPTTDYGVWWQRWHAGRPSPALLIGGETGVGKSLMAEFIGYLLNPRESEVRAVVRAEHPSGWTDAQISAEAARLHLTSRDRFVKFNAAALTASGINDYLMGSVPGSWTDVGDSVGQLARAAHGVFFLDEIGDMPADAQAAILTFLDDRMIRPKGMNEFSGYQHIIAATNVQLEQAVSDGAFRKDLLARFPLRLEVPPLRARGEEDLKRLLDFLAQDPEVNPRRNLDGSGAEENEYEVTDIDGAAVRLLVSHDYRNGNFREFSERVHESIRVARRRLSRVVAVEDVPPAETPIRLGQRVGRRWRPTSRGGY